MEAASHLQYAPVQKDVLDVFVYDSSELLFTRGGGQICLSGTSCLNATNYIHLW